MAPNDQRAQGQRSPARIEQRAGDRAVQIGQVFGNVVFQLLSPKTAIIIIAALAVAAISVFYLYRVAQKPARFTGDFNIAVAEFGEVTDEGIVSSALARQLSKMLFEFLEDEYKATDFGLDVQVGHKKIGMLAEDREAEQLSYDIDADVVIYGSVFVIGNEAILSPRFYVTDQPDTGELTGQHFAEAIKFDTSSLSSHDKVYDELRSRAATLVFFTEGLVYLSADDLDATLRSFEEAIREAESRKPFEGQEVLYLFAAVASSHQGDFEEAEEYLDQALSLNPEYARAFLARGNIYYNQALQASFDESLLDQALAEYERALEAQDQPKGAYVRDKVNISLGNIYVIQAQQTSEPELFDRAIYHYDQVVARYEETKSERMRDLVAIAYFGLGAAYERQKDYTQAVDAYRRCIDLASDSELKSRAERQLGIVKGQD